MVFGQERSGAFSGRRMAAALAVCVGLGGAARAQSVRAATTLDGADGGRAQAVAIWVHPGEVARSAVLVAEGDAGLALYALDGGLVQRGVLGGTVTDVDVALAPPAALGASSLVLAVDAARRELVLLTVDPATLALQPVPGTPIPEDGGVRLGALHVSRDRQRAYVFAAEPGGSVRQWELVGGGPAGVRADRVRSFPVLTNTLEDLQVDDLNELLYLVDRMSLSRIGAAPDGGQVVTVVDFASASPGQLVTPTGVSLFSARDGGGYLLVADAARNTVVVYERGGTPVQRAPPYFVVLPPDGGTAMLPLDRVAVQAFGLGGAYDAGLMVTADSRGGPPQVALVPWAGVAAAFTPPLRSDPLSDPRGPMPDGGTPDAGGAQDGGVDGGADGGGPRTDRPGGGGSIPGHPESPGGCGCTGGGGAVVAAGLVALLGLLRRRAG